MSPETAFWLLATLSAAALLYGVLRPERMYEYPYFMAAAMAVFILPQGVSLLRFPGGVPEEWVSKVLAMGSLCLLGCFAGYTLRPSRAVRRLGAIRLDQNRLLLGVLLFIAVAWFCNRRIGLMTPEETGGSQWTGPATIYGFFADLSYPALAIALTLALRGFRLAWLLVALSAVAPVQAIIFYGRREQATQFLFVFALALYFQRRVAPPRIVLAAAIAGAMLFIPATSYYRIHAKTGDWTALREFDWIDNFVTFVNSESTLELRNAALLMQATAETGLYQFGAGYWDQLVFRFVPAQLVGMDVKRGLMLSPDAGGVFGAMADHGYEIPVGTTLTGMGDSFLQLGWAGFLFFVVLGALCRSLWAAALEPNALLPRSIYILTATSAMRALTHGTADYLPGLFYNLIFVGGLVVWARKRPAAQLAWRDASAKVVPPLRPWPRASWPEGSGRVWPARR